MGKAIGSPVTYFLNCKEINYCITVICFSILKKVAYPKVLRKRNMQSAKTDKGNTKKKKFMASKYCLGLLSCTVSFVTLFHICVKCMNCHVITAYISICVYL